MLIDRQSENYDKWTENYASMKQLILRLQAQRKSKGENETLKRSSENHLLIFSSSIKFVKIVNSGTLFIA